MEVQHYDTNSNYLEIPTLVLPDGQKADEGLTSINRALSGLRDSYLPLLEGPFHPVRMGMTTVACSTPRRPTGI